MSTSRVCVRTRLEGRLFSFWADRNTFPDRPGQSRACILLWLFCCFLCDYIFKWFVCWTCVCFIKKWCLFVLLNDLIVLCWIFVLAFFVVCCFLSFALKLSSTDLALPSTVMGVSAVLDHETTHEIFASIFDSIIWHEEQFFDFIWMLFSSFNINLTYWKTFRASISRKPAPCWFEFNVKRK